MVNVKCPNCEFRTGDYAATVVATLLQAHHDVHHRPQQQDTRRGPKVDRPEISDDIEEEEWNTFAQNWKIYVQANRIDNADIAAHLYSCCKPTLKSKLNAVHQNFLDKPTDELLPLLKNLTVIPIPRTVKQNQLLQMKQDASESIRTFFSRVKAKARTCSFRKKCDHPHVAPDEEAAAVPAVPEVYVDYTDEMIIHVVMNGLYDEEILRDVSGDSRIDTMEVNELISLIERKETARDSASASNSAISQYRHQRRSQRKENTDPASHMNNNNQKKEKCPTCGTFYFLFRKMRNGQLNKKPFQKCKECWNKDHNRDRENSEITMEQCAVTFDISSNELVSEPTTPTLQSTTSDNKPSSCVSPPGKTQPRGTPPLAKSHANREPLYIKKRRRKYRKKGNKGTSPTLPDTAPVDNAIPQEPVTPVMEDLAPSSTETPDESMSEDASAVNDATELDSQVLNHFYSAGRFVLRHHVFEDGCWKMKLAQPHPTVNITLSTNINDYKLFKVRHPPSRSINVTAVVDSGAQVCVWSWNQCKNSGYSRADLIPVKQKLNAVSKTHINIHGAILLRLQGTSPSGDEYSAAAIVYISPDVTSFYMSKDVMIQLGIVPEAFPAIGGARQGKTSESEHASLDVDVNMM